MWRGILWFLWPHTALNAAAPCLCAEYSLDELKNAWSERNKEKSIEITII